MAGRLSSRARASPVFTCRPGRAQRSVSVRAVPPDTAVADSLQVPPTLAPTSQLAPTAPAVPDVPILEPAAPVGPVERLLASAPVRAYLTSLEKHPLSTKCWTSCSGFLLGDVAAQLLTEPDFHISRTLILAAYGFLIDAPAGNAFYNWLDSKIEPTRPKTAIAVGKKILIDQLLYAPAFTCILYAYLQAANGDAASIPEVLQDKALPTLMANYAVWPLAHALNFYYVPTEQRILYNNFVAICWTTWLSCLAH